MANLAVRICHDEDVRVYVNGVLAFESDGFNGHYEFKKLTDAARRAIKPDADNVLAVHCHQAVFGQYGDVGISVRQPAAK